MKREDIIKERLVYLQYLIDNTSNNKEKAELEKIYQCLYNCNFASNGKLRSLSNMFTYCNQLMIDNGGKIPGLPTNEQIEKIDKKAKAFKELKEKEFDAYMTRLNKSNLDKESDDKDDSAKTILSPDQPDNDKKALDKIKNMSDIFGFTNILGLESERKPSEQDIKNKDELKKQKETGITEPDEGDKDNKENKDNTDQQTDNGDEDQTNIDDKDDKKLEEWLKSLSKEELEELKDMDDEDFEDLDEFEDKDKKDSDDKKDSKNESFDMFESTMVSRYLGNVQRSRVQKFINTGLPFSNLVQRKRTKDTCYLLKHKAEQTSDPDEKAKLERQIKAIQLTSFDTNGHFCRNRMVQKLRERELVKKGVLKEEDIPSHSERKELRKEAKKFLKTDEGKAFKKENKKSVKKDLYTAKAKTWAGIDALKDTFAGTREKDRKKKAEKEEAKIVKDKDGSEIIPRKKERGDGYTYIRKKNGEEVGYATKDEYQSAKKNESLVSLYDYILENCF